MALAIYAATTGLLAFVGWAADLPGLADWDGNGIVMQPNAAVASVAAGIGVSLLGAGRGRWAVVVTGILAGLLGAATLLEHLLDITLGIDRVFLFDRSWGTTGTVAPGRMGPPASTSFTLLGASILLATGGLRSRRLAPVFALLVVAIASVSLTGHLFGATALYTMPKLTAVAWQTSTVLLAAALGVVSALPDQSPMRLLREDSTAGMLARRALPVIIGLPLLLGYLRVRGEEAGHYDTAIGTAMLTCALTYLLIGLLWWAARRVREREVEQRRAEAALMEADRRKDEFLAILAHELRNPLAPIRNAVHLLRTGVGPTTGVMNMLDRQSSHLVRLVDDLLDVARASRGEVHLRKERIDLATVLEGAIEATRGYLDTASQRLSISFPNAPINVHGDPVRLSQVFSNLLHNASKYSPAGNEISLSVTRQGGEAVISVRDCGAGISAELLPHVFEMFRRETGEHERGSGGLGIGLALVRFLVELHGGTVEARRDGRGSGSEFVVRLPITSPVGNEVAVAPSAGGRALGHRVLVVDDNRDAADTLALVLQLAGAETRVVYSGAEAMAALAGFDATVAILDIGMPGMDGYELAGLVRNARPGATLVALTGWGPDQVGDRSSAAGFRYHIMKPVDPDALVQLLSSLKGVDSRSPHGVTPLP